MLNNFRFQMLFFFNFEPPQMSIRSKISIYQIEDSYSVKKGKEKVHENEYR